MVDSTLQYQFVSDNEDAMFCGWLLVCSARHDYSYPAPYAERCINNNNNSNKTQKLRDKGTLYSQAESIQE